MFARIFILFAITMIPAFELRASIPIGILSVKVDLPFGMHIEGMGLSWPVVFMICVASNAVLGALIFPLIDHIMIVLEKIPLVRSIWNKFIIRAQNRMHPYVEKWGVLGVALFVAVPLPGSGSYSGALGYYLLGIGYRKFLIANTIGVILAGIAVTAATITGQGFIKMLF
jgi:uncharacterized membrane protein